MRTRRRGGLRGSFQIKKTAGNSGGRRRRTCVMTMILSETLLITPTIETGPISIKSSSTATTRTAGSVRRATAAVAVSATGPGPAPDGRAGSRPAAPGFQWLPIHCH